MKQERASQGRNKMRRGEGIILKSLELTLGKALNAQQVAEYLGFDVKTIRKFHRKFGGIRVGSRYLFFEKEIFNAVQERKDLDRSNKEVWEETEQGVSNEEESPCVGRENPKRANGRVEREDRHNLFD
jgi:hypothetical protein